MEFNKTGVHARSVSWVTAAVRNGPHTGGTDEINQYVEDNGSHFPHCLSEKGVANMKEKIRWIGIEGTGRTHGCDCEQFGK